MKLVLKRKQDNDLNQHDLDRALEYIRGYWPEITKYQPEDTDTLIGLPHPYVVPSAESKRHFIFEEQYYWDSYFIALGLDASEDRKLIEGMLENSLYMLGRFGVIPNASRFYMAGRSQPPLLTSFIFHVYDTYHKPNSWLKERIEIAKQEYLSVWMSDVHPKWHRVYEGLSRYYDVNMLHDLAEAESGWDMTTRFERKCLDFLPVDLNSLLFKYETDFVRAAEILDKPEEAKHWMSEADKRREAMNKLMWSERRTFFFDYNYQEKSMATSWSLAGYYTMWTGLATQEQAAKLVANLPKFEHIGGLSTTTRPLIDMSIFGSLKAQWAYPNGWAPLHLIVVEALNRYGYVNDAARITKKWLKTNLDYYASEGLFLEKYNVVNPHKPPVEGIYPSQTGFGWTNAVFAYLAKNYYDLNR